MICGSYFGAENKKITENKVKHRIQSSSTFFKLSKQQSSLVRKILWKKLELLTTQKFKRDKQKIAVLNKLKGFVC